MLEQRCLPQSILLRGARQLLTLRGIPSFRRGAALQELSIIEDGAVLIRDGLVDSVGPSRRVENLREARHAIEIPVHGRVVMPGFIDLGLRVFLPVKKRRPFIQIRNAASMLLRCCLQYGTTSAELESGGSDCPADDLPLLRQALKVGVDGDVAYSWRLHLPPKDPGGSWETHLYDQLQYVTKHRQAQSLTVHQGGVPLDVFGRAVRMAHSAGLKLKLNSWSETEDEFLRLAAQYGLISVTGPSLCPGRKPQDHRLSSLRRRFPPASRPKAAPFRARQSDQLHHRRWRPGACQRPRRTQPWL